MSWIATVHAQSAGKQGMVYFDTQPDDVARKHAEACARVISGAVEKSVWVWEDKAGAPDVKRFDVNLRVDGIVEVNLFS